MQEEDMPVGELRLIDGTQLQDVDTVMTAMEAYGIETKRQFMKIHPIGSQLWPSWSDIFCGPLKCWAMKMQQIQNIERERVLSLRKYMSLSNPYVIARVS